MIPFTYACIPIFYITYLARRLVFMSSDYALVVAYDKYFLILRLEDSSSILKTSMVEVCDA